MLHLLIIKYTSPWLSNTATPLNTLKLAIHWRVFLTVDMQQSSNLISQENMTDFLDLVCALCSYRNALCQQGKCIALLRHTQEGPQRCSVGFVMETAAGPLPGEDV